MPYSTPSPSKLTSANPPSYDESERLGRAPTISKQPHGCQCKLTSKEAYGKTVHTLSDNVPEWALFEAVQPLFASNLPWKLQRSNGTLSAFDIQTLNSRNTLDFFKYEMKRLPDSAPGKKLSCEVYGNCLETLTDLLDLLEHLVQDHILAAPYIKELNSIVVVKPHDPSPLAPPELCETVSGNYTSCAETGSSKFDEPPAGSDSLKDTQGFTKLRALAKFVDIALEDGTDLEQACCAYLRLDRTSEDYEEGVDVLSSFNTCFESPDVSGSPKQLDFTYALEIPKTRWDDIGPSNSSGLLFDILRKKVGGCQGGQKQKHQVMLRLNGFQLEDNPMAFDAFFHPCRQSDFWQESRFTPTGKNTHNFARREFIHNLCNYVHCYSEESNLTVLNIAFDKKQLFATTSDILAHAGASPEMSLEDLLESKFLRKPTAGGVFNPGDKAVLALSLSRCLLHFFQGPWMERPWSAESVHFLEKKVHSEILDIHHPYIRYAMPNEGTAVTEPKFAKFQTVMLSFARLLLEIETGERIVIDSLLESKPEDVRESLSDILDRQDEPRGPYYLAVEGCLKFKASLASVQRRDPKMELDYHIRKVIYTTVVKHLEQNLSYFRNHKKLLGRRNVQVADRLMKSASEPAMNYSPSIQQIKVNSEAPKHPDTAQKSKYTIGWVCAIAIELAAVKALLDEEYDPLPMHYTETNVYAFGRMGKHNIVIACLPAGKYGTVSAATVASEMRWHFPDIRFYLMVGVGGGVPSEANDIRLGDVVVSLPTGISGGVIQYEFGKTVSEGKFQYAGSLNAPPPLLLNALTHIRAINTKRLGAILEDIILSAGTTDDRFSRPAQDRLFVANYDHLGQQESCEKCDPIMLVDRKFRENNYPYVHYGIIASGDKPDDKDEKFLTTQNSTGKRRETFYNRVGDSQNSAIIHFTGGKLEVRWSDNYMKYYVTHEFLIGTPCDD
ncbi:hypothetical protein TWF970_000705 [Orbilia oligospora]|uniref:DUF7580 domain-containing protein n=1 Tax=Orbilia oligospora TaxID=2813651 RepID=A0A7C8VPZ2_ORBOL|nr:hypothetical protein TWF970_000705 [Orbilia oligospora]